MSKRAILAATAILVGSFNPILAFPAFAAVTLVDPVPNPSGPTQTTLDAMQTQCDALALAHGSTWTGTLDESSITRERLRFRVPLPGRHEEDRRCHGQEPEAHGGAGR